MIERNPIEYKYNSLISSIIHDNKFIEYNEVENKYYLNEIAYKVIYFERKYREYVEQLPVLMKGMEGYGYEVFAKDLQELKLDGAEEFNDLKTMVKLAYDEQLELNTKHVEELLDLITEERLNIYKEAMNGKFEIRKADEWREDLTKMKMYVKNIEVFEKVVPICISLSKQYDMDSIVNGDNETLFRLTEWIPTLEELGMEPLTKPKTYNSYSIVLRKKSHCAFKSAP